MTPIINFKGAIERYCGLPVLGYVPRWKGGVTGTPSGTVTARESLVNQQPWRDFAHTLAQTLDIERLRALSQPPLPYLPEWSLLPSPDAGASLTLALADDEAFNFYYPDNLTLLERCGEYRAFSLLRDSELHRAR